MFDIPNNLKYTKNHVWLENIGEDAYRVGITDFAQDELGEEAQGQCRTFGRATPSLRLSIDFTLRHCDQIINTSRITKNLAQFG